MKKLFFAPLQGYTETEYRRAHAAVYGPEGAADAYFMPFSRVEKGCVRPKDLRELTQSRTLVNQIPQSIFDGPDELTLILDAIANEGYSLVDLNCGCPFAPQVKHGRGAGALNTDALVSIRPVLEHFHEQGINFSLKMRLGVTEADEWKRCIKAINRLPLEFITLHPRTATQQYNGMIHAEQVNDFMAASAFPVVLNGDLNTPEAVYRSFDRWPELAGVMIGRGALARPSIFDEIRSGRDWGVAERREKLKELYRNFETDLAKRLCGDSQLLSKLKPFWDYLEPEIGHRATKAIRKAGTLSKYRQALESMFQ